MGNLISTDHYQPHKFSAFEGYYSKFELPSGARLILIICTVPRAPGARNNVTLALVPANGKNVWIKEVFPAHIKTHSAQDSFTIGSLEDPKALLTADSKGTTYVVEDKAAGISFHARTSSRIPWSKTWDSPEALLAWLPLPLHWHVHSLGSKASFDLSLPREAGLSDADGQGAAVVHEEKNWAVSFPPAHNWLQARGPHGWLCLAGGRTMGMDAFLVGYRNAEHDLELDFRPPFALRALGVGPFMTHKYDWETRSFRLTVQDLWYKLEINASAPKGTFFSFASPMPEGFSPNAMGESLNADVDVNVFKSSGLLGSWEMVCTDHFGSASLEFGGGYYPLRGTDQKFN